MTVYLQQGKLINYIKLIYKQLYNIKTNKQAKIILTVKTINYMLNLLHHYQSWPAVPPLQVCSQ